MAYQLHCSQGHLSTVAATKVFVLDYSGHLFKATKRSLRDLCSGRHDRNSPRQGDLGFHLYWVRFICRFYSIYSTELTSTLHSLLDPCNYWHRGRPLSRNFFAMLRAHTLVFTEKMVAEIKPFCIASLGADRFAQMKEDIAQKVIEKLPSIIDQSYEYTQEALDMENTVRVKMQELEPAEFEGVL
jgi:hypothetical protein